MTLTRAASQSSCSSRRRLVVSRQVWAASPLLLGLFQFSVLLKADWGEFPLCVCLIMNLYFRPVRGSALSVKYRPVLRSPVAELQGLHTTIERVNINYPIVSSLVPGLGVLFISVASSLAVHHNKYDPNIVRIGRHKWCETIEK